MPSAPLVIGYRDQCLGCSSARHLDWQCGFLVNSDIRNLQFMGKRHHNANRTYSRLRHDLWRLLKLLFTSQPLSIQVHPDDANARSVGLPSGKTEAWYVLKAAAGAQVALGLKQQTTLLQLREAIGDGSIANLVAWQTVSAEDVVFVPAGTIHAVGADLVIAEIQQRSDTTFQLFDYGRKRELHVERAIAVAHVRPPDDQERPMRYSDERILLVSNSHFVFDRIDLAANASWRLDAERETWLLVLNGSARAG